MHEDEASLFTKSGRPLRKAARKAHGINTLKPAIKAQQDKVMKLGWNEEDQPTDCDLIYWTLGTPLRLNPIDSASLSSSSIASTSSSSSTSSDSEQELAWDCSPEQLQLTASVPNLQTDQFIYTDQSHPVQRTRYFRRNATSEHQLSRSDAFRIHPGTGSPTNVLRNSSSDGNAISSRRSRIPKPLTPSSVNLQQVNDISGLPVITPSTPPDARIPPYQQGFAPSKQSSHTSTERPRRLTQQPSNYRRFHESGQRDLQEKRR